MLPIILLTVSALAVEPERLGSAPLPPVLQPRTGAVAPDGTLWLGQPNGVVGYDPASNTWRWARPEDGLPEGPIEHMLTDGAGTVWAAGEGGGLASLAPGGGWTADPWGAHGIERLLLTPAGELLIGPEGSSSRRGHLYRQAPEGWVPALPTRGHLAPGIDTGAAFFAEGSGVTRADLATAAVVDLGPPPGTPQALLADTSGLWLAADQGLYHRPHDTAAWTLVLDDDVRQLAEGAPPWAASRDTLWRLEDQEPVKVELPAALASVRTVVRSPSGALWVLGSGGAARWDGASFESHPYWDDRPPYGFLALSTQADWLVTSGLLQSFAPDGSPGVRFGLGPHAAWPTHAPSQLVVRGDTAWWLGDGLYRIDLAQRRSTLLTREKAGRIAVDSEGRLWRGTWDAVYRWENGDWREVELPPLDHEPIDPPDRPRVHLGSESILTSTPGGTLLLLRQGNVQRWRGDGWQDLGDPVEQIWRAGVAVEDGDALVLGTPLGVFSWDGQRWTSLPCPLEGSVLAMSRSDDGTLWVGGPRGLARRDPDGGWCTVGAVEGRFVEQITLLDDGAVLVEGDRLAPMQVDPDTLAVTQADTSPSVLRLRDDSGRTWIATKQVTWWERDGRRRVITQPGGGGVLVHDRHCDTPGDCWLATGRGLIAEQGAPLEADRVTQLTAGDGALWVHLDDGRLLRRAPDGSWSEPEALPSSHEDSDQPEITQRRVVDLPSALSHHGGLAWDGGLAVMGDGVSAWYQEGRWLGDVARPIPGIALGLHPEGAALLLANGELLERSADGLDRWSDPPLAWASAMTPWRDSLCVGGDTAACRDARGAWTTLPEAGPVHSMAATSRHLLVGAGQRACRFGRRGEPTCIETGAPVLAVLPEGRGAWLGLPEGVAAIDTAWRTLTPTVPLDGAVSALVRDPQGGLWASTVRGVLYRHQGDTWSAVHRFEAPIHAMVASDTGIVLRVGDDLFTVRP